MGLVYSKGESLNLIQAMESNLAKAETILGLLTNASQKLTGVLTNELKGQAYTTGLAVFDDIVLPTIKNASTAIEEFTQGLSNYRAADEDMPNEVLDEDNLDEQIRIRRNMIKSLGYQINLLQGNRGSDNLASQTNLLNSLTSHVSTLEEEIRLLQEKIRKLVDFSGSTNGLFSKGSDYLQGVLRGVNVLNHASVDPKTGTYILTGGVSLLDFQVVRVEDTFEGRLQKMSLAEIEREYGGIVRVNSNANYIGPGYDSRYAGFSESPKEIDAIRARYEQLKAEGQMTLQEEEHQTKMFKNLKASDKVAIDGLSLTELTTQHPEVMLPRRGIEFAYALDSESGKAKTDYLYYRFEELMAQEPLDFRDPQYMEKLAAYINETGIDPRTGQEATDDMKLVAQHYGWVKGSSTTITTAIDAFLDFSGSTSKGITTPALDDLEVPRVKSSMGMSNDSQMIPFSIKDGRVDGKIPVADYQHYRQASIINPDSDTMTLGKYRPTISPDGREDWSIPGPDSYIVKAGDTSYFSLGDDWNKITADYGLDSQGKEMFKYFNAPALDDAVAQGKTIRFSHDPRLKMYEDSAIDWEWTYLQNKYEYIEVIKEGDYWYAIK